jgi:DNA-binding SARP family transcriptional activator
LINLLWSNRAEEQARNSLRQALSAIKKSLEKLDSLPLEVDRSTVRLDARLIDVDALKFEHNSIRGSFWKASLFAMLQARSGWPMKEIDSSAWLSTC